MRTQLENMEQTEFDQLIGYIDVVFHLLCLVWVSSQGYRHPKNILVFLQELCNLIINQVILKIYLLLYIYI